MTWRVALTVLAVVNAAVIGFAWVAGCGGPLAALNVVAEAALVSAIVDRPRVLWPAVREEKS